MTEASGGGEAALDRAAGDEDAVARLEAGRGVLGGCTEDPAGWEGAGAKVCRREPQRRRGFLRRRL
jgi:hypothetical protein